MHDELAELETDAAVVCSPGNQSWCLSAAVLFLSALVRLGLAVV